MTTSKAAIVKANEITMEMLRAGKAAYQAWNADLEEVEVLVVQVFHAMRQAPGARRRVLRLCPDLCAY